ncbi:MAG: peptidoglycan editing factor PgeF [Candidatus Margulisiibacteriota bacterium]|jgi:hypothetical protein
MSFKYYISTKADGNIGFNTSSSHDEVIANRQKIAEKHGFGLNDLVVMQQEHTANVRVVSRADAGKGSLARETGLAETDALVTKDKRLVLLAMGADCPLIAFHDPAKKVIAITHSGWRGTAGHIAHKTVEVMKENFGCNPEDILASIAPCAGKCCYEIGLDLVEKFHTQWTIHKQANKYFLDLPETIAGQLHNSGLLKKNIITPESCTICDSNFYSYRREKALAGRFGLFVWLE